MPWNGLPEKDWEKMDRCVEDLVAQGKDKESAIAICMSSIRGEDAEGQEGHAASARLAAADTLILRQPTDDELERINVVLASNRRSASPGDLLVFEGAVLARAERNANGDVLSVQNLHELAATIANKPLATSHDPRASVVGFYTGGAVREADDGGTVLVTDGVLWVRRAKDAAIGILTGKYKQSLEAVSRMVQCSACGKTFETASYCEHLQPVLQGAALPEGVSRLHFDMRATGGALVEKPAGTGAGFSTGIFLMAGQADQRSGLLDDQDDSTEEDMTPHDNVAAEQAALAAERDALASRVQALEAELNDLRNQLKGTRDELTLAASRAVQLAQAGHSVDKINAALPSLGSISDALFELMLNPAPSATAAQVTAARAPKKVVGEDKDGPTTMLWENLFAPPGRN